MFDALTHQRPYKVAWAAERAYAYIDEQRGRHFDARLVEPFLGLRTEIARIQEEWREPSAGLSA